MPWISPKYLRTLNTKALEQFMRDHTQVGYHPETGDILFIKNVDRFSGMYVLGMPGSGKSGELQNLIHADMMAGHAVIVLDPHLDLADNCLKFVPDHRLQDVVVLDMQDGAFPFGLSPFRRGPFADDIESSQAVDYTTSIFTTLWPDVVSQQFIPLFLPPLVQVFIDNQNSTMVEMLRFFRDDAFRAEMLSHVTDPTILDFWKYEYDNQSEAERRRRVQPLTNRLQTLFTGHSLIRNILGQRQTTINFREMIEAKKIVFIKLPLKMIPEEARLVGTILISQIHNAIFSFADVPEEERPAVSLFVDEFSNFITKRFGELIEEGRKYKVCLVVCHQRLSQLPDFLQDAVEGTRTKVCFQLIPDDARLMARHFPSNEAVILPGDIDPHASHYLMRYGSADPVISTFIDTYLLPLQRQRRGNRIEIDIRGLAPSPFEVVSGGRFDNPRVADPLPYLDQLLFQVMRERNPNLPIPPEVVIGFSGCAANVFYKQVIGISPRDVSLSPQVRYPRSLVVQTAEGSLVWTRRPEGGTEQFSHLIYHLRAVMAFLASHPIGRLTTTPTSAVAGMLSALPRRAAFVRTGDTVGVVYTFNTPEPLPPQLFQEQLDQIIAQTRAAYCRPRAEVEQEMRQPTPASPLPSTPPPTQLPPNRWEETP